MKTNRYIGDVQADFDRSHVESAIINVDRELRKFETRGKIKAEYSPEVLDKISGIYDDLIKMLNMYPQFPTGALDGHELNLFCPLMKLISVNLSQGKDIEHLKDTFSMLIWHHFSQPVLFKEFSRSFRAGDAILKQFCMLILDLSTNVGTMDFPSMYWYTRKMIGSLSGEISKSGSVTSISFIRLVTENFEELYKILSDIEDMKEIVVFTNDENKKLGGLLPALIDYFGLKAKAELASLTLFSMGLIGTLESFLQQDISDVNKKCINQILQSSRNIVIWGDPSVIATKDALSSMTKMKNISIKLDSRHSILFLLEVLDHGTQFNYSESYTLICYLSIALKNLGNLLMNGKQDLYLQFNQLNSKLSLTAFLANLNYIISLSLLSSCNDHSELPDLITKHFEQARLPPFPKADYFYDKLNSKDSFDNDLTLSNNCHNLDRLTHCHLLTLHILLQVIRDDLFAISIMNTYSSENITLKLVFRLIDLLYSTLFPSLVFLNANSEYGINTQVTKDIIFQIYLKIISVDLRSPKNSLIWVCLINFASDICYFDLKYVEIFESLFEYLLDKTASSKILEDDLVKSGLDFFFATFSNSTANYNALVRNSDVTNSSDKQEIVEISYNEYEFMYAHLQRIQPIQNPNSELRIENLSTNDTPSGPSVYANIQKDHNAARKPYNYSNNNDQLLMFNPEMANSSTPLKSNYATNFARQQSIHVDQYGKP